MTENEIWDAKWLAFKLVVIGQTWRTVTPQGVSHSFTGDRIIECAERPPANSKGAPDCKYIEGIGTHSAMAQAYAACGIPLEDAPKLRAAAKRAARRAK